MNAKAPWCFLLVIALAGCSSAGNTQRKTKAETRQIPLESMYATIDQEGLKRLNDGFFLEKDGTRKYVERYGHFLGEIHTEFRAGGSNLLLVRGKDIAAAVRATWIGFVGSGSFDRAIDPEDGSEGAPLWLVVYFGTKGSTPAAWLVQSVEQKDTTLRVNFLEPRLFRSTKDIWPYIVWIPLGKLELGTYTLELFNAQEKEMTLIRRVTVR